MSFVNTFFGITDLSSEARSLIEKYVVVTIIYYIATSLSSTFLILFYIQELGFKQTSILITIRVFVQLSIDYPSGSVGDWIGQKWVLIIASLCYCMSFIVLYEAQTMTQFVISIILFGIARAQESGAFSSWLDNNYKKVEDEFSDPDRKIFGFTKSRLYTLLVFTLGIAYSIGGLLSSLTSRRHVFLIQIVLIVLTVVVLYKLMDDVNDIEDTSKPKTNAKITDQARNYLNSLKGGLLFMKSGKTPFFFILGYALFMAAWNIWVNLFLWPVYYAYTGSDAKMSSILSLSFFIGGGIEIVTANASKMVANRKFPLLIFGHNCIYVAFILLLVLYPPTNSFNIYMYLLLLFFELFFNRTVWPIALTLYNRIMLDMVPSKIRNGVYSLIPTIVGIINVPLLLIIGNVIEMRDLASGLFIVLLLALIATSFLFVAIHFMGSGLMGKGEIDSGEK